MVLVSLDEPADGMTRSTSFTGTVNIAYALGSAKGERRKPGWRDLLLPGAYGALAGLALSARTSWATCVSGLALLWCAGPVALSSTYTIWNWTILVGQLADYYVRRAPPRLLPYLLVNSWAIFASFNVMAAVYPRHYAELALRIDASMPYFHFLNTLGHFVPGVLCLYWFDALGPAELAVACEWTRAAPVTWAPLGYHLLWAMRVAGGLLLDHVYLKRPKFQWYVAWATGAACHVLLGSVVAASCRSGAPLREVVGWSEPVPEVAPSAWGRFWG